MFGAVMRISDCRPGAEGSLKSRCVPALWFSLRLFFVSLLIRVFSSFSLVLLARRLLAWPRLFGRLEYL